MTLILLIGETHVRMDTYALALNATGHQVELCRSAYAARDRLFGIEPEMVIVDVTSPDGGLGLLCVQARAAWPRARILALTPYSDFSQTKLVQMGLWTPTEMLVHPVSAEQLVLRIVTMLSRL